MNTFSILELMGTTVVTSDQVRLGVVVDVEANTTDWSITTLFVRLERDVLPAFGLEAPLVMGTHVIEVRASLLGALDEQLRLRATLPTVATGAIVAYESDATEHLGEVQSAAAHVKRLRQRGA